MSDAAAPHPPYWFSEPHDLFAVVARDGTITALSASTLRLLGRTPQDLIGRRWQELVHPDDLTRTTEFLATLAGQRAEQRGFTNRYLRITGAPVWFEWTAQFVGDVLYAAGRDITRQRETDRRLARSEALWRAVFEQATVGMCLTTLHGVFTDVNPALCRFFGIPADRLVGRDFTSVVLSDEVPTARENVARLLHGTSDRYEAEHRYLKPDGEVVWGHTAVTLAATPDGGRQLLGQVLDITQRKRDEALLSEDFAQLGSLNRLRDALDGEGLVVYAQPIVDLRTGTVVREELLVRLETSGTLLTPDRFLPAAERFGLIAELDHWVVCQAVELARAGRAVSVNVSARSLGESAILDEVRRAAAAGLDPTMISFEITETALADDMDAVLRFAQGARSVGATFAIDDFGVGYGSLLYLKKLGGLSATLKIDRSFVTNVLGSPDDQRIVAATIALAHGFDQTLVAEGVEDAATADYLRAAGVQYGQGYHFGRPAPVARPER